MIRAPRWAAIAVAAMAAAAAAAHAQAVDVADLPPLPPAGDQPASAATVLAAAAADEDVVVGAAKREQSLGSVASAVTVVSGDRLRRFGYRTIGEAVAAVAGVYLVDNRLSYSIGVRGLQIPGDFNTRLLVLVDGASVNEVWGAFAGAGYDAVVGIEEIARIEVIRGPVSSVYGTNAFFGIINIVTRGAAETPRAWARVAANSINGVITSAGFAAGSVDRQVRGSVQVMSRFGEDGLALPDGGDIHAGSDGSRSYIAGVVAALGGSFAQARAVRFSRESPFAPYDVSPGGPPYDQYNTQLLVEGGHTRELSDRLALAGRVYANLYEFSDSSPPSDPAMAGALDTRGTAQTYGVELRGRYELVVPDRLGVTAGGELSYSRTRSTAQDSNALALIADVPVDFNVEGVYAELDAAPTSWLGFTGGLRFDRHSNAQFEDRLSPRAALFLSRPERYGVKLLYAEGFRNPSTFEAFFSDGSDFAANPALGAETIRSAEVVAWAKPRPGLAARLSYFHWDARDIIEALASPEDSAVLQFQNVTRYVSTGVEAELSYRNSRGWYAFGGAALTRVGSEDAAGAVGYGAVTNAPVISGGLGLSTPKLLGLGHLSSEWILLGERPTRPDQDGAPSPPAPAWLGWNLVAFVPGVRGFDITAGVRNLLGRRDLIPTPGDYDRSVLEQRTVPRVPGEGREVYVKVGYSY